MCGERGARERGWGGGENRNERDLGRTRNSVEEGASAVPMPTGSGQGHGCSGNENCFCESSMRTEYLLERGTIALRTKSSHCLAEFLVMMYELNPTCLRPK